MSIRFQLTAMLMLLLLLALALFVAAMIVSARPRIEAENESMMRLAQEFIETAVESLQGASDPNARLDVLVDGLKDLRHVRIYRAPEHSPPAVLAAADQEADIGDAPKWFTRFVRPEPVTLDVPVTVNGQNLGDLVIIPHPGDETAEIWDSIVKFSMVGFVLAVATVLLKNLSITHLLRPIGTLGNALLLLNDGKYDVRVTEAGAPEIIDICRKLNRLAATLERTTTENRRLTERIISVQDDERRELARELHDELGPYLFAIRAGATALKGEVERGAPNPPKIGHMCETLLERIDTMQRINRGVLNKLKPMGLEEFGLAAKLTALASMWREDNRHIELGLSVANDMPILDETTSLTIYRIVQEGLTNAFRHAEASRIDVVVEVVAPSEGNIETYSDQIFARLGSRPLIHVSIADNGKGLKKGLTPGYGLTGISERVWATGGIVEISDGPTGGVTIDAWVPATRAGTTLHLSSGGGAGV